MTKVERLFLAGMDGKCTFDDRYIDCEKFPHLWVSIDLMKDMDRFTIEGKKLDKTGRYVKEADTK